MGDMPGRVVLSKEFAKHDNNDLWSVVFPLPDAKFLGDFQWEVYYKPGQPRLDCWCAVSMRKDISNKTLEIRFRDRAASPVPPSDIDKLQARLVSPSV